MTNIHITERGKHKGKYWGCAACGVGLRGIRSGCASYCYGCMSARKPIMNAAMRAVKKAIERGLLPPIDGRYCVDCGAFAHVYDHRDYSKPLSVDPVCRSCNRTRGPAA